jgi:hypothetical protein
MGGWSVTMKVLRTLAAAGLARRSVMPTLGVFRSASVISECSEKSEWVMGTTADSWRRGNDCSGC